jgi:L-amino acid N-acyltransferase
MPEIRDATEADLPGINTIRGEVIATSTAIFAEEPGTLDDRHAWLLERREQGYPVLVAVDGDEVIAFASFGDFRDQGGYENTVEHTIHVRPDARSQGVGSALLAELIARAGALSKHVMVGAVDAANDGSLRFHERHGFVRVAQMPEVGRKHGEWLDLVLVQLLLE